MNKAKAKSLLWDVLCIAVLGVIYWSVIAEGLRLLLPSLGVRIHQIAIPGANILGYFEATYKLDLAHALAMFLFIATWNLWEMILKSYLGVDEETPDTVSHTDKFRRVVLALGLVVISADALLFYIAMGEMQWGVASAISLPAIIATACYVAILVFAKLKSITLSQGVVRYDYNNL